MRSEVAGRGASLHNKVAIVTGASRGIGRTACVALASEGATLVAAARRADGPGSLEETVQLAAAAGGAAIAVRCDVSNPQDVQSLADAALSRFGRIDLLVNNAGVGVWKQIQDLTVEDWDMTMDVNLKGAFLTCKYVVPHMMRQRSGNVINVSSSMALRWSPKDLVYSTSKAALDRFSLNLAEEVREHEVAVNSYYPGYVATEMTEHDPTGTWTGPPDPPETVVPGLLWLARQTASTFTGQIAWRRDFGKTWGLT